MATEKLLKAVISGPVDKLNDALRHLVLDRDFHPLDAKEALKSQGKLEPFGEEDPYKPALEAAAGLLDKLGVEPGFREYGEYDFSLEDTEAYLNSTTAAEKRLSTHRNAEAALAADDRELIKKLSPFRELSVDLARLLELRYVQLRFGFAEKERLRSLEAFADADADIMLFRTGENGERIYLLYLCLPDAAERAAAEMDARGFEIRETPYGPGFAGIPPERIVELEAEAERAEKSAARLSEELAEMSRRERDELLSRWSWLKKMASAFELRQLAAKKGGEFLIVGWLPESQRESFEADAEGLGVSIHCGKPGLAELGQVPVLFKDSFLNRIFAPFVEMYGFPAYGESDPRLFMTVTYCLLFGVMFGDIGQGAVLALIGLFMTKKNMWLGRILSAVGCSAIVFGFVYGSIFGNEHLLPGFKVLEEGNLTNILLVSAGVGIALIVACGMLNIITGFRQHDYKKAIFSANGICGVVFIVSAAVGAVGTLLVGVDLLGNLLYTAPLILLPLLLIWCGEPIVWLMEGKHGEPPSVGMVVLEGFFDLFESCLSWFSNILSFLRVGTYTICHAIMMMVVYTLSANGDGGYSIFGLVLGNAFVMLIEAVLVCIQVLRLEFYELFGRFYSGRGASFRPRSVDYRELGVRAA